MNEFFEQTDGQLYGSFRLTSENLSLANEELEKISADFEKKMAPSFAKEARWSLIGSAAGFLFAALVNLLLLLFVYDGLKEMFAVGFQWLLLFLEILALVSVVLGLTSHFVNQKIIKIGTPVLALVTRKEMVIPQKTGFSDASKPFARYKYLYLEFVFLKDEEMRTKQMRISYPPAIREFRNLDNFFIVLDQKGKHFLPVALFQKNIQEK